MSGHADKKILTNNRWADVEKINNSDDERREAIERFESRFDISNAPQTIKGRLSIKAQPIQQPFKKMMLRYYNSWKNGLKISSISHLLKQRESGNLSCLINGICSLVREYKSCCLGSIVDSEQMLLHYLTRPSKKDKKKTKTTLQYFLEEILNVYARYFDHIKLTDKRPKDINKIFGFIINVHTTREVCLCCAASIAQECFYKKTFDVVKKTIKKDNVFITFTISASEKINSNVNIYRPPGIPDESKFEVDKKRKVINLNDLLKKNNFSQLLLSKKVLSQS